MFLTECAISVGLRLTKKLRRLKQPIKLGKITSFQTSQMPYVSNAAIEELTRKFGKDAVLKGGLRIQTTIDSRLQRLAEDTARRWISTLNYQGVYADQMAIVSIDPRTHFVKAMVGGVDAKKSEFNRATQAKRQPGSAFKPFVYYAAFASRSLLPGFHNPRCARGLSRRR